MALPGAANILNAATSGSTTGGGPQDDINSIYTITHTNWYKTLPYGFVFYDRGAPGGTSTAGSSTFWLPISPSNITTVTHFATNIVTTLYGVVEEHSEIRYYDITINGTTGYAPRHNAEKMVAPPAPSGGANGLLSAVASAVTGGSTSPSAASDIFNLTGRSAFENNALDLGGFLPEVTNTINQVVGVAQDIAGFLGGGSGNPTGITPAQNGYVAFHNFYRYLHKYKLDAAGLGVNGGKRRNVGHSMQFLNYKDGIKYDCIPITFTLTRSNQSPMLYNYNIKLRCFNLRNTTATVTEQDQLAKLGLSGIEGQSIFSSLTGAVGSAATLVSSIF